MGLDSDARAKAEVACARASFGIHDACRLGILGVSGDDALDFLHRLTTNDFRSVEVGSGRDAVFVTAKGRILHHVLAYRTTSDELLVVNRGPGIAGIAAVLERFHFREKVEFTDRSADLAALLLVGPEARSAAERIFGIALGALGLHAHREIEGGGRGRVARTFPVAGGGYLLLVARAEAPALAERFVGLGAARLGAESWEHLRIAEGHPIPGAELTEEHNPLEANLRTAVHFAKGCYVGQEVIARLENYGKVSRCLARLAIGGDDVRASGDLLVDAGGRTVGAVTSVSPLAEDGSRPALGYVRSDSAAPGTELVAIPPGGAPDRSAGRVGVVGPAGFSSGTTS